MLTKLLFWPIVIIIIVSITNNTIDFNHMNGNLVITVDYSNFFDNTVNVVNNSINFFTNLLGDNTAI